MADCLCVFFNSLLFCQVLFTFKYSWICIRERGRKYASGETTFYQLDLWDIDIFVILSHNGPLFTPWCKLHMSVSTELCQLETLCNCNMIMLDSYFTGQIFLIVTLS